MLMKNRKFLQKKYKIVSTISSNNFNSLKNEIEMNMYQELLDEAMLGIVKKVLSKVQFDGLDRDQSFYISFNTEHPDVKLSKHVRGKYPKEITIVLQYQYRDLEVFDDKFKVNIAFGGVPETIEVPFEAIVGFVDPSANFSLQFKRIEEESDDQEYTEDEDAAMLANFDIYKPDFDKPINAPKAKPTKKKAGKVIAIEDFRNRNKNK